MRDRELRNMPGPVEFRAADGATGTLTGYAAVFNRMSQNLGGFVEQVDPRAFNKSLADQVSVFARFNHADSLLLGTTDAGTLQLEADGTGLRYTVDLPDTTAGRDVAALAKRGDLRHSSFAFQTMEDSWDLTQDGFPLRTLLGVRLIDVAPVTNPAYLDTTTGLRSLAEKFGVELDEVKALAGRDELRSLMDSRAHGDGQIKDRQDEIHRGLVTARRRLFL